MMDLLERYLQAVRFFLPRQQQDDIIRELSENVMSQIEEREDELGRPLTEEEQAEILRRHGHPMVVAGQYRTHRHLIGPVFFPLYLTVLKMSLLAALVVTLIVAAVMAVLNGDALKYPLDALLHYPGRALTVFAWTTLGFAGLDFAAARMKLSHKWDPRTLPKMVRHEHRLSRANSFTEFLFSLGCLVWLLLFLRFEPFPLLGPAASFLDLAPIWRLVYVPMLALTAGTTILALTNFTRPFWTPARSFARIALDLGGFAVFVALARAGEWVVARAGATAPGGGSLDRVVEIINSGFEVGFVIGSVVSLIGVAREVIRLRSRRRMPAAAGSEPAGITR